jgi:hypothetical protein
MKKAYSAPMIMVTIMETTPLMDASTTALNGIIGEGDASNTGDDGTVYSKPHLDLWEDENE